MRADDPMDSPGPDWCDNLRTWFKDLIQLSFDSAALKNGGQCHGFGMKW